LPPYKEDEVTRQSYAI